MSYTPERWHFQDNTRYRLPWTTNPYSITTRKTGVHGTTIANIPNRKTVPDAEQRANAMLIAHAPEMLELLRRFIGWYSNKEPDNFHKVMPFKNQPPEIQDAMKLIEKTTGESYV
jgi:hypothetical protein